MARPGHLTSDGVFLTVVVGEASETFVIANDLLPSVAAEPTHGFDGSITVGLRMPDGHHEVVVVAPLDVAATEKALAALPRISGEPGDWPATSPTPGTLAPPPPPSGPYAPPAPGMYGSGPRVPIRREHPQGTTILVLGILGLTLCCLLAPFAWAMGNTARREMASRDDVEWTNRGTVEGGRVCGIVGTCLVLGVIALFIVAALASGG